MYNEKLIKIFQNPTNAGSLRGANAIGKVGNAKCGDIMKIYMRINEQGIIEDASFKTFGCAAAIASTNVAIDLIRGKTIEQALAVKNSDVVEILGGMPAQKIHCSILAEEAIKDAINNYYKRLEKLANKENKSSVAEAEDEDEDDE